MLSCVYYFEKRFREEVFNDTENVTVYAAQAETETPVTEAPTETPTETPTEEPTETPTEEPTETPEPGSIMVHIIGAVVNPGVYEIPYNGRYLDAVTAAGGLSPDADETRTNLALYAYDTEQIKIYRIGEEDETEVAYLPTPTPTITMTETTIITITTPSPAPTATPRPAPNNANTQKPAEAATPPPEQGKTADGKININTADAALLATLPGIGSVTAGNIITYREQHGGFLTIEDIKKVPRIGDATFDKIKDKIAV